MPLLDELNEKIATIEENVPKVYDAGYQKGKSEGVDSLTLKLKGQPYEYYNEDITILLASSFHNDNYITTIDLPNVEEINVNSVYLCSNLKKVNFPNLCRRYGDNNISNCDSIEELVFPKMLETLDTRSCKTLKKIDYPIVTSILDRSFLVCSSLTIVILRNETMVTLNNINAFLNCDHFYGTVNNQYNPDGLQDGYVYVPRALIEDYKVATNWSSLYASHPNVFRVLEDYTVDGTITGELDESKI